MADGGCSTELSAAEERRVIRRIAVAAESQTKEGDVFCIITHRWWHDWLDYVSYNISTTEESSLEHHDVGSSSTSKRPSSIDNSILICEAASENSTMDMELDDTLVEGTDYVLLPEGVWNQLHAWYGGGPILARKVIDSGNSQQELSVEVYPLRLYLHMMPKGEKYTIRLSKKANVEALQKKACELFDLNIDEVCIWDYFSHRKHALLNDPKKTLDEVNIQMDQDILVEIIDHADDCMSALQETSLTENDAEPSHRNSSIANKGELSQFHNLSSAIRESERTPTSIGVSTRGSSVGLTGLLNFGNTCFMNSAIQCLVHTPEFAKFFQENYHQEINWHNPLGMVGELATAFGDLLRKLWAPGRTPFAPRQFKAKLARFAPQFSGYNQHDSQELLAFLLDGLHEDLNRVKHKPYINSRDADGRPDEEVADEYWANHISRNDSIIVDVCQGQYKSTLVCPVCDKISVTFDPFMYLSLPLQSTTTRTITVTVFSCDGSSVPITCTLTVPKQGRCKDLIQALNGDCPLKNNEKILLAEIRNHLIHRFLDDPLMSISSIKDDDHLGAYKIPKSMKNMKFLQLIHRHEDPNLRGTNKWKPYGTPLVFPVSCDSTITRADIQLIVHTMLSPMLKRENSLTSNTVVKIPIKLVDYKNAVIDVSVGDEQVIRLPEGSISVLLFIDWTPEFLNKYEIRHLEKLPEVSKFGIVTGRPHNEPLSLYTCVESFLQEEPLVPQDMWYCPQCKERRQASKKLDLWRLPDVVVIHLKRFSYSRTVKHKVETFVDFPIHDFDLTNYVATKNNSDGQVYELYALINHYGGMGSGHYTAHIKKISGTTLTTAMYRPLTKTK